MAKVVHDGAHKYKGRRIKDGSTIYACVLPNCTHYLTKNFIINKISMCLKCNDNFEITKKHIKGDKITLKCSKCMGWNKEVKTRGLEDLMKDILSGNVTIKDLT